MSPLLGILIARLRDRIREMLVILHQSYFFQGDWYHVQKDAALEGTSSEIENAHDQSNITTRPKLSVKRFSPDRYWSRIPPYSNWSRD